MKPGRRINHPGDRLSKLVRDSMKSDCARGAGDYIKSFVFAKPMLSACIGLATGIVLGMLVRRSD